VVCRGLWQDLPPEVTTITRDHLHAFGDVNQALSRFYQRSIKKTIQESGVREQDLRAWFEKSLITPAGTRGTVYRGRQDTGGIPNQAVQELEDLHLIRGEWRAGARWYELTHDRFIGPIEASNETWRTLRRMRRVRIGLIAAVAVLGLLMGLATLWTTEATRTVLVEATVAAAGISQVKATAAVEATQAARENQATATASAAESSDLASAVLRARVRPLKPGLSVSGANGTAGTLGAFVRDTQGRLYLLSVTGILGTVDCTQISPDTQVIQPGQHDGGLVPDDVVGYFARCLPLADGVSVANLAGLARLADGVTFETIIPGIGPIRGIRTPTPGMSVRKLGRTTGLTTGEIQKVGQSFTIAVSQPDAGPTSMQFVNAVATSRMSDAGDSGALVVDEEGYAIGIVVAGSQTTSLLAPIQDVLDSLGVQLVHAGQELLSLDGRQGRLVLSAAWSPDSTRVGTASQDGTAHLWDARTGEELAVWEGHKDRITAVVFDPSGERAVTASYDGTARLWDAATGKELAIFHHGAPLLWANLSPDGQLLVTGGYGDTARVWDVATGEQLAILQHEGAVHSGIFSPDGTRVATASLDFTARVWDVATGEQLAVLQHEGSVNSAIFSPDRRWILTASSDNTARVWEADTGEERAILQHDGPVWSAVFSPDGQRVATASQDGTARVWQVPTGARIAFLEHGRDVFSVRFSPDGSELATASADGIARVWDATDVEWVLELSGHAGEVVRAAWSPDGIRVLTVSRDGTARIWQGK
jgi:WD40 repeat protein